MTIKETDLSAANYVAEQEVKEESARNMAHYLGEEDARHRLDPDPTRHAEVIAKSEYFDYRQGYEAEVRFRNHVEELDRKKALREAAEKETLRLMTIHTEDITRKLVPAASQRFKVIHYNMESCVLNPDEHGFATFEAAKLRALDILQDRDTVLGDEVHIEDKGAIAWLSRKED